MNTKFRSLVLVLFLVVAVIAGCSTKDEPIATNDQQAVSNGQSSFKPTPSASEGKAKAVPTPKVLFAKRTRIYKQVDGMVVAPKDVAAEIVLVIRIADLPPTRGRKMRMLAGGRQYESPYTFFPMGRSWQEITVVVPEEVTDCELSLDGIVPVKFKAEETIREELEQTLD